MDNLDRKTTLKQLQRVLNHSVPSNKPETLMKNKILAVWACVWLKKYYSSYGKDVGHSEQQDCDEYHWLQESEV